MRFRIGANPIHCTVHFFFLNAVSSPVCSDNLSVIQAMVYNTVKHPCHRVMPVRFQIRQDTRKFMFLPRLNPSEILKLI